MDKYLREARLEMPSQEACTQALADAEALAKKRTSANAEKLATKTKAA
jgi:hypothetical protein